MGIFGGGTTDPNTQQYLDDIHNGMDPAQATANYNKRASEGADGPTGNTQGTAGAAAKAAADAAAAAKAKADYDQAQAHFEYGGWAGGAAEASNRYASEGAAAQGRQGEKLALGAVNDDRNANAEARGNQMSMASLLAARANGSMPSIAGMRANQDISRALADQSSLAAGARGPAALALAQQNQANNSAQAMGNISNSAQINTAQEQLNNTLAADQAYTGIRSGDQSLMGADAGVSIAQAQIDAAQREANDRYQLGMTGYETGVQGAQLNAQGNQVAIATGAKTSANALAQQASQFNADRQDKYLEKAVGAAQGAVSSVVQGVGKSATGSGPGAGSGGGGDGGYGAPGSTPGGYDKVSGAPVAGTGGGFDPDAKPFAPPVPPPPSPNVSESLTPGSTQSFKAGRSTLSDERTKTPANLGMSQMLARSDDRAPVSTALSTTHTDTTGPAAPSVSMARMIAARDAENERQKKAKEYGGLVASTINGLGQAFAQQPQAARITPVTPQMQQITVSDDKSKLAAAWDQGHNDALDQVQKFRQMSPDELKAAGARGNRIANAVRGAKADAYDEARGVNQSMTPPMTREPTSFTREQSAPVAYVAPQAPPSAEQQAMLMPPVQASMSDDASKLSLSSTVGRRHVGTLGPQVSSSDMAAAARSMRSVPYSYKDEYARREGQAPGEVNVGPVAQEIEKSRIGATIVKPDPNGSGMRTIDQSKMVKVLGGIAADHQDQLDEQDRRISLMARRLGGAR